MMSEQKPYKLTVYDEHGLAISQARFASAEEAVNAHILTIAREAYRSGHAGQLARHVADWQQRQQTAEFGQIIQLRKAA